MDHLETGREVLDTILGYLGFAATVETDPATRTLNVSTSDSPLLVGHHGERLDEIEYLVNRIVQDRIPKARRFRVDIGLYRASAEHRMLEEADALAAKVLASGKAAKLEPMNSYQRRIVHNHFAEDPRIETWSPPDSARLKRITLRPAKSD